MNMINDDTIKLMGECDAGIKMAVSSIDEVLPKVKNENLKQRLITCKQEHEKLGNETHSILKNYDDGGKEPSPIAKGMSWMKTNAALSVNPTDNAVADLITDGCNMGVKSLNRYLNQYEVADAQAKDITGRLIRSEEQLSADVRAFL
jgi:hypothetical protein